MLESGLYECTRDHSENIIEGGGGGLWGTQNLSFIGGGI